ncbi:MAG: hypothetical protein JRJ03_02730 [Deltaproteobacteria bacterium]|nr:hypothetical protein [Deltaproteobacteria bacterium]
MPRFRVEAPGPPFFKDRSGEYAPGHIDDTIFFSYTECEIFREKTTGCKHPLGRGKARAESGNPWRLGSNKYGWPRKAPGYQWRSREKALRSGAQEEGLFS